MKIGDRNGFVLNLDELVYLNSGIDCKLPFGINYSLFDRGDLKRKEEIVRESLKEKKLLTNQYSLNESSFIIMRLLEEYKESKNIVQINTVYVSVQDEANGQCHQFNIEKYG